MENDKQVDAAPAAMSSKCPPLFKNGVRNVRRLHTTTENARNNCQIWLAGEVSSYPTAH